MKIQDIRQTQDHGLIADVWLTPRSILSVSIPVDQCTLEALVEYAIRDDEHDKIADAPAIVVTPRPTYDELIHGAKFTNEHRAELQDWWNKKYDNKEEAKRLNVLR